MAADRACTAELAATLRVRLLKTDDACTLNVSGEIEAAVLVALFDRAGETRVVFTRRRHDLRQHPGEVSFPGGRRDPGDLDLVATALRESHEEIGLDPSDVEIVGGLRPTPTVATGYAVHPFVGVIAPAREWLLSHDEVAAVLELSVAELRAGYGRRPLRRRGLPVRTDTFVVAGQLIWGATARILQDLLARLDH